MDVLDSLEQGWEGHSLSEEEAREASEANLCPKGRWEGQLDPIGPDAVRVITTERGDHPLEGKTVVRLAARLYTDAGEKHVFFDAYPGIVKAIAKNGGEYLRRESTHAALLYKATKMFGRPFSEVLEFAQQNRLVYDIGVRKEREDKETGEVYPAENFIRGVYPVKEA
jgi:hypothetical protein